MNILHIEALKRSRNGSRHGQSGVLSAPQKSLERKLLDDEERPG